jgi:hypothetical protein
MDQFGIVLMTGPSQFGDNANDAAKLRSGDAAGSAAAIVTPE